VLGAEFARIERIAGNVERSNLKAAALDRIDDRLALARASEQFVDAHMWRGRPAAAGHLDALDAIFAELIEHCLER